jgi:hypothetical protein
MVLGVLLGVSVRVLLRGFSSKILHQHHHKKEPSADKKQASGV